MVNKAHTAASAAPFSSVTQLIADGLNTVLARPLLVLIPLLVDSYYLLGWKITLGPLLERLAARVEAREWSVSDRIVDILADVGKLDLTGMFWIAIPSFLGGIEREGLYDPVSHSSLAVGDWLLAIFALVMIVVSTALMYAVFGIWLADTGMSRSRTWGERLRMTPATGVRILGLVGLVLGLMLLLVLPIALAWIATAIAGADMRGLFLPMIGLVGVALVILFSFAPEALFVAEAGPAEAMRLSAQVVKRHTWPALAFVVATTIISWGLSEIWERMAANPPGMMLAILASALVGCSLAMAAMLFFDERWRSLEPESMTTR